MQKKGYAALVLLLSIGTLCARERSWINLNEMDYIPHRSHRFSQYSPVEIFRADMIRTIDFHAITTLLDGTLGWASSTANGTGAIPVTIGKIYIRGLYLPQGNTWEGRVYPTEHIIIVRNRTYPLFQLHPVKKTRE